MSIQRFNTVFKAAPTKVSALKTISLFGMDVVNASMDQTTDTLLDGQKRRVAFVNAHCINVAAKDTAYTEALKTADFVLPDGIGVSLAAKLQGHDLTENLNGTDLGPNLLAKARTMGLSVFFFGAAPGVAQKAADNASKAFPGLAIAGVRDGFDGAQDTNAVINHINASGADIVLVAMGVPMQDVWIRKFADNLNANLVMGVGALFDFMAGRVSRAPKALRALRSEWMWRLAVEPRRMAKRYLVGNFTFMARAIYDAMPKLADMSKRGLDLAISGGALIALSPLFALIAIMIKLDSRGPVFFMQTRVGQNGKTFGVLKFRSMYIDAEERKAALLATSDREGVCFKSKNDPRVTRIGGILRRYSLDELPQIINIARGDMAVVGPRPALPQEVAAYPARALGRLTVKPGLTGIWQVSGRADIGFDKMIDMDLAYTRSRTLILDIVLIALTFRAVVTGRGAY
ncbi:MAG: WecB/TagA/CpsF family glycosyltransferase [Planktomarina sp.]